MENRFEYITRALERMSSKKWEFVYIAIDLHGVIVKPTYIPNQDVFEFYPGAIEALQYLSTVQEAKLILFTGSYPDIIENILSELVNNHVYFDYVNENPEVENTSYMDTRSKFHFDVLFDDKAGFNADTDWLGVIETFKKHF